MNIITLQVITFCILTFHYYLDVQYRPQLTKADIPSTIPADLKKLIERTFSQNADECANAAKLIGEMHERAAAAIPFLIRLNDDERLLIDDSLLGYEVRRALFNMGEPALQSCIEDAKKYKSYGSISSLGLFKYKYPKAIDALLELLDNGSTRRTALIALKGCTDTRVTLPLLNILTDDPDVNNRAFSANCFKHLRDPRSVEPLIKALNIKDTTPGSNKVIYKLMGTHDPVRSSAITALGFQCDKRAVPALLKIFQQQTYYDDEWDRHRAAKSLGMIGDKSVLPVLYSFSWNPQLPVVVRSGAVLAIGMFHDEKGAYERLISLCMVYDTPFELKVSIVKALAEYGDKQAIRYLKELVDLNGKNELAFWSAMSAVKLMDGAIDDASVIYAIQYYRQYDQGVEMFVKEKHDAIELIAKNGASWHIRLVAKGYPSSFVLFMFGSVFVLAPFIVLVLIVIIFRKWKKKHI